MRKQDVCVYIENEAQLKEARELLEKYGEEIDELNFYISQTDLPLNYLRFFDFTSDWSLALDEGRRITLSQLEEILKR